MSRKGKVNPNAFDDWEKEDLNKHALQVGYSAHKGDITRDEEKRVNQMLRCQDIESVELAKTIIENLNESENGKTSNQETS